jgi:hypothetical protein
VDKLNVRNVQKNVENALDLQQTVLLVIKMIQASTKSYKLELESYKIKIIINK